MRFPSLSFPAIRITPTSSRPRPISWIGSRSELQNAPEAQITIFGTSGPTSFPRAITASSPSEVGSAFEEGEAFPGLAAQIFTIRVVQTLRIKAKAVMQAQQILQRSLQAGAGRIAKSARQPGRERFAVLASEAAPD